MKKQLYYEECLMYNAKTNEFVVCVITDQDDPYYVSALVHFLQNDYELVGII